MPSTSIAPLTSYIEMWGTSPLARWSSLEPWQLTTRSSEVVEQLIDELTGDDFVVDRGVAIHRSAIVEAQAVLKAPAFIGARCFIAAGAYVRGGCWIDADCILGPGAELKSSFMFSSSKLAHFNFVGDSILGSKVNLEAGSIVCNYRNERDDKQIRVRDERGLHAAGIDKFGALIGDGSRIGANAVIAPGALISPGSVVGRGQLLDQERATSAERITSGTS